ncbi:MAG: hypothetical protein ACFFEO_13700 [Candidatus Thorarchaeota archaeon]
MSKELKDLINKAEEEQQTKAYLEKTIEKLQLEVERLRSKLDSKVTFKPTPIKHITEQSESQEIVALKDIVYSLNQKLEKKEEEKELLQNKIKDLTLELDIVKEEQSDSVKDEVLSRTQNSLTSLIQDYGRLEQENKTLKKKLVDLSNEIESTTKVVSSFKSESSMNQQLKSEIATLKQKISSLELENTSLAINLDQTRKISAEQLDKMVEALKGNNYRLEEENKALNEKLEALKREKLKIFKLESQITDLNETIESLKQKNKELREKDTILLAKTITALKPQNKKGAVKPESDIFKSKVPEPSIEEEQLAISKVNELSKNITNNLIKPYSADKVIESKTLKEENLQEPELETMEDDFTRKWQCPNCGNSNKAYIREMDDKTRIIYAYPKIYAKKYKCGQCGVEWK